MADRSFGGGRRRRFGRVRVLVGLSPVIMLGSFMLAERVSAIGSGPQQFAGSATVVSDEAAVAVAEMTPGPAEQERRRPDTVGAQAAPGASPAPPEPRARPAEESLPQPGDLGSASAPAAVDRAEPAVGRPADRNPLIALRPVLSDERGLASKGWRVAPEASALQADVVLVGSTDPMQSMDAMAEDVEVLAHASTVEPDADGLSQPTWRIPTPAPRPARSTPGGTTGAEQPITTSPGLPVPAVRPAQGSATGPERAVPLAMSDIGPLDSARVVIHRPGDAASADARDLLGNLQAQGVGRAEIRAVAIDVGRPDIRYFHPRDRAIAEQVRAMLAGQGFRATIRDFTHFDPAPSRGTVEVWLPG